MFLENVYTGFTKDGKERCLQKKYKILYTDSDDVSCSFYEDLETREKFENSEVDEATLNPITNLIVHKEWEWRRKVVSIYQADRESLIDVKNIFFGNLVEFDHTTWSLNNRNCEVVLLRNALFTRGNNRFDKVMDLNSSLFYNKLMGDNDYFLWGNAVRETSLINYSQFDKNMQPKRKILEMNYKKEL